MKQDNLDGGYAWVTLAGSSMLYLLSMGTYKVFGILYKELLDKYQYSAGTTAFIGSLGSFIGFVLSPLANALCTKFSFRKVTFIGGLLLGTSYFLSSFVDHLEYMFFTYSVLEGIGFSLIYGPTATLVKFYFDKWRAVANGILAASACVGMFILSYLYRHLFDIYGFNGGVLVIGGILFNCCVASSLFQQPPQLRNSKATQPVDCKCETSRAKYDNIQDCDCKVSVSMLKENDQVAMGKWTEYILQIKRVLIPRFELFRNVSFCIYSAVFALTMLGYTSNLYMLPSHVDNIGYTKNHTVTLMLIIGISETISRLFMGWFVDLKIISAQFLFTISMFVSGISAILITFTTYFPLLCVYVSVIGIFPGTLYLFVPVILVDIFGLKKLPATHGLVSMSMAFVFLFGQPVLGWLEDKTGNWRASFITSGIILIMSGSLVVLEGFVKKNKRKEDETKTENVEEDEDVDMLHDHNVE